MLRPGLTIAKRLLAVRWSAQCLPWQCRRLASSARGVAEANRIGWHLLFCAGVVGAAGTTYVGLAAPRKKEEVLESRPLTRYAIADVAEGILPCVVNIMHQYPYEAFGQPQGAVRSNGSGFIIDEAGLIVTNAHVVLPMHPESAAGSDLLVTLSDGRRLRGAVHAYDRQSDIALVRVNAPYKLPVARLGDSSKVRAGEWVVAVGSPMSLSNSVTCGIVSAPARLGSEFGMSTRTEFIQTDAAINSGNSGGPLLNLDGEVIGINTMKLQSADSIGFAIPGDVARRIVDQLRAHGRVIRPYIGVRLATVERATYDPEYARRRAAEGRGQPRGYATMPAMASEEDNAILVIHVMPGSPADRAGLRPEDIIVAFDGRDAHMTKDVLNRIGLEVGREIQVVVRRPGVSEPLSLKVKTEGERPKEPSGDSGWYP